MTPGVLDAPIGVGVAGAGGGAGVGVGTSVGGFGSGSGVGSDALDAVTVSHSLLFCSLPRLRGLGGEVEGKSAAWRVATMAVSGIAGGGGTVRQQRQRRHVQRWWQ